jgi:hypothetical protein
VVFEHVIDALVHGVHGSGYERIATTGCSDRTIRPSMLTASTWRWSLGPWKDSKIVGHSVRVIRHSSWLPGHRFL